MSFLLHNYAYTVPQLTAVYTSDHFSDASVSKVEIWRICLLKLSRHFLVLVEIFIYKVVIAGQLCTPISFYVTSRQFIYYVMSCLSVSMFCMAFTILPISYCISQTASYRPPISHPILCWRGRKTLLNPIHIGQETDLAYFTAPRTHGASRCRVLCFTFILTSFETRRDWYWQHLTISDLVKNMFRVPL